MFQPPHSLTIHKGEVYFTFVNSQYKYKGKHLKKNQGFLKKEKKQIAWQRDLGDYCARQYFFLATFE